MYIKYTSKKDPEEFGIWEITEDFSKQRCVYYSDGSLGEWGVENARDISDIINIEFCNPETDDIDILTQDQVEEIIFLDI